jgi:hypothetical protein
MLASPAFAMCSLALRCEVVCKYNILSSLRLIAGEFLLSIEVSKGLSVHVN